MSYPRKMGFSLVEVVLALGIVSLALLSILGLLTIGVSTVQISAQEMRATDILSMLTTDLRNTGAGTAGTPVTQSLKFQFPIPYAVNASGRSVFNTALTAVTPSTTIGQLTTMTYTIGADESESPVALTTNPPYQVSVIYVSLPTAPTATAVSYSPIQARLIVNWPPLGAGKLVSDLTTIGKVKGYVEAFVTYPAP